MVGDDGSRPVGTGSGLLRIRHGAAAYTQAVSIYACISVTVQRLKGSNSTTIRTAMMIETGVDTWIDDSVMP